MIEGSGRTIVHLRSPRHLRILVALERSRRSLEKARSEIAEVRTETSSLEGRLVEREVFAHSILDGIDLGIVTADSVGDVTFVNRTAKELLNVTRECTGPVATLLGLASAPEDLLGHEETRVIAYPLSTRDGDELDLELSVSRASDVVHHKIGYFFIFRDTREEKARSLERERLERLAAIGTMVAGFAHEVRNPVASLRSLAESLVDELSDAKITVPHVSRMLQVLDRIERLVRTSLQFGRPSPPQRESCRPWAILAAAVTELEPRTNGKDAIRIELEPDLPDLFVDEAQLVQVLVILLNNAIDSVGGQPRRVRIHVGGGRAAVPEPRERAVRESQPPPPRPVIRFEVHDDGGGIPPAEIGRIFDPFYTTKASGTGLGLSIAQQLVNQNGGAIEVSSQRGATVFSILVPLPEALQWLPSESGGKAPEFRAGRRMP